MLSFFFPSLYGRVCLVRGVPFTRCCCLLTIATCGVKSSSHASSVCTSIYKKLLRSFSQEFNSGWSCENDVRRSHNTIIRLTVLTVPWPETMGVTSSKRGSSLQPLFYCKVQLPTVGSARVFYRIVSEGSRKQRRAQHKNLLFDSSTCSETFTFFLDHNPLFFHPSTTQHSPTP